MGILLITQGPLHERSQGFTVAMPAGRAGRPVQPDNEGVNATRMVGRLTLKKTLKKLLTIFYVTLKCFIGVTRLF